MPTLGELIPGMGPYAMLRFHKGGDEWVLPTIIRETASSSILIREQPQGSYTFEYVSNKGYVLGTEGGTTNPCKGLRQLFNTIFEKAPYEHYEQLRGIDYRDPVEDVTRDTELGVLRLVRIGASSYQWAGDCGAPFMLYEHQPVGATIHLFVEVLPFYPFLRSYTEVVKDKPVLIFEGSNVERVVLGVYDWIHDLRSSARLFIQTKSRVPPELKTWADHLKEPVCL